MDEKETRPAYDLRSWLYHQHGARLYRLCARTRADCVLMADGVDAETRINTIERALAANTTTRLVKSLAERDGLTGLIPGDRVFVGEGEEAGCYAWIPPQGWVLLWSGKSPIDLAEAVGEGIGLDASGRLYVEWEKAPLAEWVGAGALRVEGGVMVVGVTDSLTAGDSGVCASAKAAKILYEKIGDVGAEAAAALGLANEGKVLAASAEIDAREARGDAAAAAIAAKEAGASAAAAIEAAEEALTEGGKTAALLAEARVELLGAKEDLAEVRAGVKELEWLAEHRENIEKLADLVIPPDLSGRVAEIAADQVNLNERFFERGIQIERIGADLTEAKGAIEELGADVNQIKEEAEARGGRLSTVESGVNLLMDTTVTQGERLEAVEETLTDLGEALAEKVGREEVFLGATATENAAAGLVPGATTSERGKFLRGDGLWAEAVSGDEAQVVKGIKTFVGQRGGINPNNAALMYLQDPAYSLLEPTDGRALLWYADLEDDPWLYASLGVEHGANGNNHFIIQTRGGGEGEKPWYTFRFRGPAAGNGSPYAELGTPPAHSSGIETTSCAWVLNKLGAGASLATSLEVQAAAAPVAAMAFAIDETEAGPFVFNQESEDAEALAKAKADAVAKINAAISADIYGGFVWSYAGHAYGISYSLFDQQNLADAALQALANPAATFPFFALNLDTGQNDKLQLAANAVLAVHKSGLDAKNAALAYGEDLKARVLRANSVGEIDDAVRRIE